MRASSPQGSAVTLPLPGFASTNLATPRTSLRNPVYAGNKRLPIHRWVSWIAGFSSDFAGDAIDRWIPDSSTRHAALILDPFAGVGTTLIEAQRRGIPSIGFEINPFPALAARAKLEAAAVDPESLRAEIRLFACRMSRVETALDAGELGPQPSRTAPPGFRTRVPFFSPRIERKVLHVLDYLDAITDRAISDLFRLAFATTMVSYSNYTFEPSLSSRPGAGKALIEDAPVSAIISAKLSEMADDVEAYSRELRSLETLPGFEVYLESVFDGAPRLAAGSVDLVVTSPPYLNNYHYVRNTRPHLYWLGYVTTPGDQRQYEVRSFGKFWQTVREAEQIDLIFDMPQLSDQIAALRKVNPHKGIYGGGGWANYAATYFNDSYRLIMELRRLLRPGGTAVIVVGNNILQGIEFKVDDELVNIGHSVGLDGYTEMVRSQRVGSSIMGTGLREKVARRIDLYEAAVVIRQPHD